nr:atp-dependent rna helicase rok1 [Quercus suber]
MDALRLLSRSTRRVQRSNADLKTTTPSDGQPVPTQHSPRDGKIHVNSRKRKRNHGANSNADVVDFFREGKAGNLAPAEAQVEEEVGTEGIDGSAVVHTTTQLSDLIQDRKAVLRQHKLKCTWLNSIPSEEKTNRTPQRVAPHLSSVKLSIFPRPLQSFGNLRQQNDISEHLAENILEQGYTVPTEVQIGALPLLLGSPSSFLPEASPDIGAINLLTVAPTGSGKTLAFMIPLIRHVQRSKYAKAQSQVLNSAVILAPTKELVGQIVNEGRKLARGTGVKVVQVRKGMQLHGSSNRDTDGHDTSVKADILVSTPGLLHSMISDPDHSLSTFLSATQNLVLDEADVLLDPLFREQTLGVWDGITNGELRVSLWSATMGSNIENLACSTIERRKVRLNIKTNAPLIRLVVGLKDSAIPTVEHKLVYAATEQGKLMGLRQLLHPSTSSSEARPSLRPPFLVFTQTIERAVALHSELMYDIPVEAGGISRIAVLHSDLSDTARASVMTRFRKGEVWVLITTDLLSRGVDFQGINGVVNYDIPTSSAAYIHRVGRTGRAGRTGGVAVTLYSKEDVPYLKHVANVVAMAQKRSGENSKDGLQQWLLDALPTLSKQDKQKLKKRGIESRTTRGKEKDPKAARRAKISTKPGFQRKTENNRKGAMLGSQRRKYAEVEAESDSDDQAEFSGFA